MQDSHRQLSSCWSLVVILVLTPVFLWAIIPILPTFDDWTSLTSPSFEPLFTKKTFLFYGYHWRPFDAVIGHVLGLNPQQLFPTLNHCLVVAGHVACSFLLYRLLTVVGCKDSSKNLATLFFFLTPATMATVLAVDSMNQVYALLWGMVAFLVYIRQEKWKYPVWVILLFIATLCKENGLMWALICPVLAYGFRFIERRTLQRDLLLGMGVMAAYALAIVLLPKDIEIHPEYIPDELKVVRSVAKFLLTTFVTVDYVWLLHQPARHLPLAAATLLLSLPFCYLVVTPWLKQFTSRRLLCIVISLCIAVAPHVLTTYSMMHTYAGLVMVALIVALSLDAYSGKKPTLVAASLLLLVSFIVIDTHLWHESVKSGQTGKQMAKEAIRKTSQPVRRVYLINIDEDYPKLSSFCVLPYDAFGWGLAVRHETGYQWPEHVRDTLISRTPTARETALQLGRKALKGGDYDCVWITDHQHIDVIKK